MAEKSASFDSSLSDFSLKNLPTDFHSLVRMSDPSVEDLWAGLDNFETELQGIQGADAPQASTLDKIDDLLRLVEKQEASWDMLPAAPIEEPFQMPQISFKPFLHVEANAPSSGAATASPRAFSANQPSSHLRTPREQLDADSDHQARVDTVRKRLIAARGADVTDLQRNAIERLLSLAKPGSDELDDLIKLDSEIRQREDLNRGAPAMLVEHQNRLDSDNVLLLEKRLAERLVPRRASTAVTMAPQPVAAHASSDHHEKDSLPESSSSQETTVTQANLDEFDELQREAEKARLDVSNKTEFFDALAELEKRSAAIQRLATGEISIAALGALFNGASEGGSKMPTTAQIRASLTAQPSSTPASTEPTSESAPHTPEQSAASDLTPETSSEVKEQPAESVASPASAESTSTPTETPSQPSSQSDLSAEKTQEYERELEAQKAKQEEQARELALLQEDKRRQDEEQARQIAMLQEDKRKVEERQKELLEARQKELLAESAAKELAIEQAKQQALEKARQEFQAQLEEAKRTQEAELATLRAEREAERQNQAAKEQADREAHQAQLVEIQRRQSVADLRTVEAMRQEALQVARRELEEERKRTEEELEKARAEMELKLTAEREAHKQSRMLLDEAFRAKLLAESRATQEVAARRDLETQLATDEKEKEALQAKLLAGEESKRLLQARVEMEAQQLHQQYLDKIEALQNDEKARAGVEAEEKAKLKEQLLQIKAEAGQRMQENETAMLESRQQLEKLQKQKEATEQQLSTSTAKVQMLEAAKERANNVFASIEAEHGHISEQFETTLRNAEIAAIEERDKLHQVAETQKDAAHAALSGSSGTGKEHAIRNLADAEKTEQLEQAEVERQAVLAAEREAIVAEKNRELENRMRLERVSEQMRHNAESTAPAKTNENKENADGQHAARAHTPTSELQSAVAPFKRSLNTRSRSAAIRMEKTSATHIFHSSPKESVRPTEDILSYYSAIAAVSPIPSTHVPSEVKTAVAGMPQEESHVDSAPSSPSQPAAAQQAPSPVTPSSSFHRIATRRASPVAGAFIGLRRDASPGPRDTEPTSTSPSSSPPSSTGSGSLGSSSSGRIQVTTTNKSDSDPTPTSESEHEAKPLDSQPAASEHPVPAPQVASASSSEPAPNSSTATPVETKTDSVVDDILASVKLLADKKSTSPSPSPSSSSTNLASESDSKTLSALDDLLADVVGSGPLPASSYSSSSSTKPKASVEEVMADVDALLDELTGDPPGTTRAGSAAPSGLMISQLSTGGSGGARPYKTTNPAGQQRSGQQPNPSGSPNNPSGSRSGPASRAPLEDVKPPSLFKHHTPRHKQTLHICVAALKNRVFECEVDQTQTIASLKLFFWVEVLHLQSVTIPGTHLDYVFCAEENDYFSDEKMRLCDTPYYLECTKQDASVAQPGERPNRIIRLNLVSKQELDRVNSTIETMLGHKMHQSEEAMAFRKEMNKVVNRVSSISYRRVRVPHLSPFENVEDYLPAQFNIHVWFWHETSKENHQQTLVTARLHDTASSILQRIINDHPYQLRDGSDVVSDYVLKVRGLDEWVWDFIELIALDHVRQALRKRRKVELVVYSKEEAPTHVLELLRLYENEFGGLPNALKGNRAALNQNMSASHRASMALDAMRSSVAVGFDLNPIFQIDNNAPATWFKSWDLSDKPLTIKILRLDHIAFDSNLFKLPKKRDALTHIFVAATVVTPAGVASGSQTPYTAVGPTARTLPDLYLEESLEPIIYRADLFLPTYAQLPRASKLRLEVVVRYKETETIVAWFEQPIFNTAAIVQTGLYTVACSLGNSTTCTSPWSFTQVSPTPSSASNAASSSASSAGASSAEAADSSGGVPSPIGPQLVFEVLALEQPVVFPSSFVGYEEHPLLASLDPAESNPIPKNQTTLNTVLNTLLHRPTRQEQALFWKHRLWCQRTAKSLDMFLSSIPWHRPGALQCAYLTLDRYQSPSQPLDAIQILNKNHLEPKFREHAVRTLHRLSDSELAEVLLQLVQSLKHEVSHDSALARFLLVRALFNQNQIGHYFYWHLKACMQVPAHRERFSLVLEAYLRYCGTFREDLLTQTLIYNRLISIATELKTLKDPTKRVPFLHEKLNQMASQGLPNPVQGASNIAMPSRFQLPINCNLIGREFNVSKCKNLESKTLPLWLVAESADPLGDSLYGIMKVGDDLRQDQLTLQMFGIMDKLWLQKGLDLKMSAYRVIETGSECGMIEVVPNAQTNAQIQKQYGGVTAAFSDKPLSEWLAKNNPNEHDLSAAIRDFASSCAGYCVATYVLGIGDRHNDNIMITKSGHLFHIDFGRFLGNSEKFAGVSRDRAPFVFTPEFAFVMGGPGSPTYQRFVQQACQAYNIVRKNAALFISLLSLMLQTGIPELRSEADIQYLADAFSLELTDEEASRKFEGLISKSLETTATQLNFAIHIWANPEK